MTVVIVTYNNENTISDCLNSLCAQLSLNNSRIIVIDNHSSDATCDIVKGLSEEKGGKVELVLNRSNLGFTKALNQGLARSLDSDLTLILNPDVILKEQCLGYLKHGLQDPNVGVMAPQLLNSDGTIQPSCRRFPQRRYVLFEISGLSFILKKSAMFNGWKMGDFDHISRRRVEQPQGAFLLCANRVLKETGLWDERFPMFFSDVDWCKRVYDSGYHIIFEPQARAIHKKGVSVYQERIKMIWTSHLSFISYFRKYDKTSMDFLLTLMTALVLFVVALLRIIVQVIFNAGTALFGKTRG